MAYIVLGVLSFAFFYIFDINKLYNGPKWLNISFGAGVAGLSWATLGVVFTAFDPASVHPVRMGAGLLLAAGALYLLVYALFFALPFEKTYADAPGTGAMVIDTGLYALCRHPGVHAFFLFYAAMYLAFGAGMLAAAGFVWWLSDILHVYIQDRLIFPRTLDGYEGYRERVPFLIPNRRSAARCLRTWRKASPEEV